MNPLLAFDAIGKRFGAVPVLQGVSFTVGAGQTVGLVGENGAGKSTLMNILGGNLRPDGGRMTLAGQPYEPAGPAAAAAAGIAFIHQELNLFPNLSVAENLFLTRLPRAAGRPWIHRAELHRRAATLLAEVGLDVAPATPLSALSPGERQLVEIAQALRFDPRLIILDEPTTSLSARETEHLFALMGRLRTRGLAMIYISHNLADVLRLCDTICILRDGELVGNDARAAFTPERLIALMVGRSLTQLFPDRARVPERAAAASAPVLEVRGLSEPHRLRDVSFTLHAGEVLGLGGLMGAGRSELARVLFGLDAVRRGSVRLAGVEVMHASVRRRIRRGLAFLTEDRRDEGLCLDASIADNIGLVTLPQQSRPPLGVLRSDSLRQAVRGIRAAVRLTATARDDQPAKTLSGGNQQKVVLAKWLLAKPRVLILDEPTRGIDVGARFEVYQLILQLADAGAGVLLISSEIEELMGLCDRLLVMRWGEIVEELRRAEFDRERILRAALHETEAG